MYNSLQVQVPAGPFCITIWELGLREPVRGNADTLVIAVAVNNKVHCLWPRNLMSSISFRETDNVLVDKYGKS